MPPEVRNATSGPTRRSSRIKSQSTNEDSESLSTHGTGDSDIQSPRKLSRNIKLTKKASGSGNSFFTKSVADRLVRAQELTPPKENLPAEGESVTARPLRKSQSPQSDRQLGRNQPPSDAEQSKTRARSPSSIPPEPTDEGRISLRTTTEGVASRTLSTVCEEPNEKDDPEEGPSHLELSVEGLKVGVSEGAMIPPLPASVSTDSSLSSALDEHGTFGPCSNRDNEARTTPRRPSSSSTKHGEEMKGSDPDLDTSSSVPSNVEAGPDASTIASPPKMSKREGKKPSEIVQGDIVASTFNTWLEAFRGLELTTGMSSEALHLRWTERIRSLSDVEKVYSRFFAQNIDQELARIRRGPQEVDVNDPDIVARCFLLFQRHEEDWQGILAYFRAKETAGLSDISDPEQAWEYYLDDLRDLTLRYSLAWGFQAAVATIKPIPEDQPCVRVFETPGAVGFMDSLSGPKLLADRLCDYVSPYHSDGQRSPNPRGSSSGASEEDDEGTTSSESGKRSLGREAVIIDDDDDNGVVESEVELYGRGDVDSEDDDDDDNDDDNDDNDNDRDEENEDEEDEEDNEDNDVDEDNDINEDIDINEGVDEDNDNENIDFNEGVDVVDIEDDINVIEVDDDIDIASKEFPRSKPHAQSLATIQDAGRRKAATKNLNARFVNAGGSLSGGPDKWPGNSWLWQMATNELCCVNWPHKKVPWLGTIRKTHDGASKGIAELMSQEFRNLEEALRSDGDGCIKFEKVSGGFKSLIFGLEPIARGQIVDGTYVGLFLKVDFAGDKLTLRRKQKKFTGCVTTEEVVRIQEDSEGKEGDAEQKRATSAFSSAASKSPRKRRHGGKSRDPSTSDSNKLPARIPQSKESRDRGSPRRYPGNPTRTHNAGVGNHDPRSNQVARARRAALPSTAPSQPPSRPSSAPRSGSAHRRVKVSPAAMTESRSVKDKAPHGKARSNATVLVPPLDSSMKVTQRPASYPSGQTTATNHRSGKFTSRPPTEATREGKEKKSAGTDKRVRARLGSESLHEPTRRPSKPSGSTGERGQTTSAREAPPARSSRQKASSTYRSSVPPDSHSAEAGANRVSGPANVTEVFLDGVYRDTIQQMGQHSRASSYPRGVPSMSSSAPRRSNDASSPKSSTATTKRKRDGLDSQQDDSKRKKKRQGRVLESDA